MEPTYTQQEWSTSIKEAFKRVGYLANRSRSAVIYNGHEKKIQFPSRASAASPTGKALKAAPAHSLPISDRVTGRAQGE